MTFDPQFRIIKIFRTLIDALNVGLGFYWKLDGKDGII